MYEFFASVYVCPTTCMPGTPGGYGVSVRVPGTELTDGFEPLCRFGELNPGLL